MSVIEAWWKITLNGLRRASGRNIAGDVQGEDLPAKPDEVAPMGRREVIGHHHLVPGRGELIGKIRSDEPGSAGNQNPHMCLRPSMPPNNLAGHTRVFRLRADFGELVRAALLLLAVFTYNTARRRSLHGSEIHFVWPR